MDRNNGKEVARHANSCGNASPAVEIDSGSGFCFGVTTAIRKAEEELANGGTLYCLGDIVHNSMECERLKKLGLVTINHDEMERLRNVKVLLRAHGEPPETYAMAKRNGIEIIDATCPVVLQLQRRIKSQYDAHGEAQIVIFGKPGHAEVLGLVGQTQGSARVIAHFDDVKTLDFSRDIYLYSQTTKSLDGLRQIEQEIARRKPSGRFECHDTICRQVANRMPRMRQFAQEHSLVLFVSGRKSSNGMILYNECRNVNANTHMIYTPDDIDPAWLDNVETIGICGATSTPLWLMTDVRQKVEEMLNGRK